MADVVKETHYHDGDAPARSSNGIIAAVVLVLIVLLALLLFSNGFGRSGSNSTESPSDSAPNVEVEGGASGGASGTMVQ